MLEPSVSKVYGFEPGIARREGNPNRFIENLCPTLRANAGDNQPAVCYPINTMTAHCHAICYNGENITSPTNAQNPKIGDPCHTLGTDSRNYVVIDTPTICVQGSMIGRADKNGPQGSGVNEDVSFTLNTTDRHAVCYGLDTYNQAALNETAFTLRSASGGDSKPAVCYGISSYASNSMKSSNPHSGVYEADTSRTIDRNGGNPACNQGGIAVVEPYLIEMTSTKNTVVSDGICPTLTARMGTGGNQVNAVCLPQSEPTVCCMVAFGEYATDGTFSTMKQRDYKDATDLICYGIDCRNFIEHEELYPTLRAKSSGGQSLNYSGAVRSHSIVRRLTPLECERLQGYPDNWTKYDEDGREISDSQRYKALGNSFAVPNAYFFISRIVQVLQSQKEEEVWLGRIER